MPLNPYRIMWLFVFFDLPAKTKKDRKDYTLFRKRLMKDGFTHMQHSVYLRHCGSTESAEAHSRRMKTFLPTKGDVSILRVTDKQFGMIENFVGRRSVPTPLEPQQLEMF
ncbi:CRISPR-associated endonuclease Cas2 [Candidatus Neomarinimicrobiota bacterium]